MARLGRGDLDDRLVGLDRHERLIGDDVVADADVPRDDLGFLEALTDVGQDERAHTYSRTFRAAVTMRCSDGM